MKMGRLHDSVSFVGRKSDEPDKFGTKYVTEGGARTPTANSLIL